MRPHPYISVLSLSEIEMDYFMENKNPVVERTFDLLNLYEGVYADLDVALGGKSGGSWYTYTPKEYVKFTNQVSLGFLSLGLKKGDKVAMVSNNRPEWNFIDLGLAQLGVVHIPIYPTISLEEYEYILNHCEAQYVIVGDKKLYDKITPLLEKSELLKGIYSLDEIPGVPNWKDLAALGEKYANKEELESIKKSVSPKDLASIIYTSGTTGVPKGVMLSHENLVSNFTKHAKKHDLKKGDKALSFLPLCHVFERSMNYHFQYKGFPIYYVGNLGHIMSALKEIQPDVFCVVPRLLERIYDGIQGKSKDLKGIKRSIYNWAIDLGKDFDYNKKTSVFFRYKRHWANKLVYSKWREIIGGASLIIVGGAALQPRIARILGIAGVDIVEGYGLTETSPVIAVCDPHNKRIKIGTVGPVLEGVDVKFGEDGEILCKGPNIMMGYYKDPERTKDAIDENGYFHTGDIGQLIDGIYLKITDRKKEIFKLSGGKYIAPQVIENKLKESNFIEQAIVVGENEKFASAIISPDFAHIELWCKENSVEMTSREEIIKNQDLLAAIQKDVNEINKTLGQVEEIKRFRVVADTWTPSTGELSPTLKLKRNVLAARYNKIIEEIFATSREEEIHSSLFKIKLPQLSQIQLSQLQIPKIRINLSLNELITKLKQYNK